MLAGLPPSKAQTLPWVAATLHTAQLKAQQEDDPGSHTLMPCPEGTVPGYRQGWSGSPDCG